MPFFFLFLSVALKGVSCEVGEIVFGCVLDWDLDKEWVVVSLNPQMVAEKKSMESRKGKVKKVTIPLLILNPSTSPLILCLLQLNLG